MRSWEALAEFADYVAEIRAKVAAKMDQPFKPGDYVQHGTSRVRKQVVAIDDHLAWCRYRIDGKRRDGLFFLGELKPWPTSPGTNPAR